MLPQRETLGRRIFRDTAGVSVVNGLGNILVYLMTVLVAAVFGADARTDALNLALTIPMFTSNVVRGAIQAALVPALVEFRVRGAPHLRQIASGAVLVIGLVTTALMALLWQAAPLINSGLGAFLPPQGQALLGQLNLVMMPMLPLLCVTGALAAVLNTHNAFRLPAALPGLEALVKIVAVLALAGAFGIYSLALGHVGGALAGALLLGGVAMWKGYLAPRPAISELRAAWGNGLYSLLGISLLQFNPYLDRYMASILAPGSVTALNYAERTAAIPYLLVGAGFFGVVLARWAELFASEGAVWLQRALRNTTAMLIFLLAPVVGLMVVLRFDLVSILFRRGAFDAQATELTASALAFLALAIIPNYIMLLVQRVYLVTQDARTPMFLGLGNTVFNLVFNLLLIGPFGLAGIAFSTALTWLLVAVIGWAILRRRMGSFGEGTLVKPFALILTAALACVGVALVVQSALPGDTWPLLVVRTGLAGGLGLLVYAGLTWALGVEEARKVNFLTRKGLTKAVD